MNLDQHRQIQLSRQVQQTRKLCLAFHTLSYEQNRIRAESTAFVNLIRVDDKILAQHGQPNALFDLPNVLKRSLKELLIGQAANGGRATCLVRGGDLDGMKNFSNQACRRTGFLDLRDHTQLARGLSHCLEEITR